MNEPEQEQIDYWLNESHESIHRKQKLADEGYYRKKNISIQGIYTAVAIDYADLGRARCLNKEPLSSVRHEFNTAAKCIKKSFRMAYDRDDPDYVGDKLPPEKATRARWGYVSWSDVDELNGIYGFNFSLVAANFDTAQKLATLFQDRKNGKKMEPCINRYAHALKHAILLEKTQGQSLLELTLESFATKPPKQGYKANYFNLSKTLSGILTGNELLFNQGLEQVLTFYKKVRIPGDNLWDTDYEFICDDAVALANLGLSYNLMVTVEHELLPKRLLLDPSNEAQ
ncbi:hypothetical protein SG34_031870 [Thalassomonas viridans]|uniref:Uncharacterized protein n=1 Tax=Thalassomonas viridans TaxID=137584 RepID=A0AAE9ZD47_9GAMM|nr:hypothetical protein [Thalassomonas viridans]WDE08522.1 hypothetical protein SG34_031870 [Thalassomonas viridans]